MKSIKTMVILSTALICLLGGGCTAGTFHERAEKNTKTCISEEGTNMFGKHYIIPGVVDKNGKCVELLDTAPKITKSKTIESISNEEGYVIRIVDLDGDGRADIYLQVDNKTGEVVLKIFKDLKTGDVYSECTLPGRAILGEGPNLEDSSILDSYNDIIINPSKYGYKVAQ